MSCFNPAEAEEGFKVGIFKTPASVVKVGTEATTRAYYFRNGVKVRFTNKSHHKRFKII